MGKKINYLDFFKTVGKSKRLPRSGWVREKVNDPESVAEHSFRVGVLITMLGNNLDPRLDKNKLLKMVIVHGLSEVVTGDVVVERWDIIDVKKRDEKEKQEREGIKKIFNKINQSNEYLSIFDEMVARDTLEAEAFWQLDNLEMVIQALEYEEEQGKNLEEFFLHYTLYYVRNPFIKGIFEDILKSRKKEHQASLIKRLQDKTK